MSKKFVTFGKGWNKEDKITCAVGGKRCNIYDATTKEAQEQEFTVFIRDAEGNEMPITGFFMKPQQGGLSQGGKQLPDYNLTFVIGD